MLSDLPVLSDLSPWRRLYTCLLASIQLDSAAILFSRDTRELHAICTHPTLDCSSILPYRHTSYHVLHWIVHPSYPILLQLSLSYTFYLVVHCSAILHTLVYPIIHPTHVLHWIVHPYLGVPYHTSYTHVLHWIVHPHRMDEQSSDAKLLRFTLDCSLSYNLLPPTKLI